ncbi:hypothetical protein SEA_FINDLEY_85 [Mycobacterium phage Findley]|uniref:Uncharacterized protein n=1 Tax=Mycobacterium phage Findley TaxID=2015882 RepID=A0A222ZQ03_9CAUD|nr:hypothetical protein I5G77_gp85 [Mycobacterium phage Findley]ASR86824.1 hypothetical protein SEA_FINDLEY_85 [Mycobacterium phage Findley]
MLSVQPGMNVPKQRRKIEQRLTEAPSEAHARYLRWLLTLFDESLARGLPRPASEFLPMYDEEFDQQPPAKAPI